MFKASLCFFWHPQIVHQDQPFLQVLKYISNSYFNPCLLNLTSGSSWGPLLWVTFSDSSHAWWVLYKKPESYCLPFKSRCSVLRVWPFLEGMVLTPGCGPSVIAHECLCCSAGSPHCWGGTTSSSPWHWANLGFFSWEAWLPSYTSQNHSLHVQAQACATDLG